MASKQPHLNASYYGPSIPPPSVSCNRSATATNGGPCCDCVCCCCRMCFACIFNFICQLLIAVLITVAAAAVLIWLIFRPNLLQFHATDAALTSFNLTAGDKTLHYDLALNITIRNPNSRIGIYHDEIQVSAFYDDFRFGSANLSRFYQGHKNTSLLSPSFVGQIPIPLTEKGVSKFDSEMSAGIFRIDVKLFLRIRFKFCFVKFGHYNPKIKCPLKVPLKSNNGVFEITECEYEL